MQQRAGTKINQRRRAGDRHHWHSFREGTSHAVNGAQFPDAIGRGKCTDAPNASITVGGIGGVEFIAGADILDIAFYYLVEET
jgi:hypothetical protein